MMKWLRAHSKQIMVVVVLLSMFAFLGSQAMIALLSPKGEKVTIAKAWGNDITNVDMAPAQRDTQILEALGIGWKYDPKISVDHWYVLSKEADRAGIVVPDQEIEDLLNRLNESFKQMGRDVDLYERLRVVHQITPPEIREAVGRHLAIQKYAGNVINSALPSESQVRHYVEDTEDKIKLRMATLNSEAFLNKDEPVTAEELQVQFDKNKDVLVSESETGYGYKYPRRVKLQYLVLNLPQIENTLKPEFDEVKNHWKANKSKYTKTTLEIPATAPTSGPAPEPKRVTTEKVFSEAMPDVERDVRRKMALQVAEQAMQRAASLLNKPWVDEKTDPKTGYKPISPIAQAPDFMQKIAARIEADFKIPVRYAETTLLTGDEIAKQSDLKDLQTPGDKDKPLRIEEYAFRIPEFYKHESGETSLSLQLFQTPDESLRAFGRESVERMGLFRVIEARESQSPASLDEVRALVERDVQLKKAFDRMDAVAQELYAVSRLLGVKQAAVQFKEIDLGMGAQHTPEVGPLARMARVSPYLMQRTMEEGKPMTSPWNVPGVGSSQEFIDAAFAMTVPNFQSVPTTASESDRIKAATTQPTLMPQPKVALVSIPKLKKKFVIELIEQTPVDDEKYSKQFRQSAYYSLLTERMGALRDQWFSPTAIEKRTGFTRLNREPSTPGTEGITENAGF